MNGEVFAAIGALTGLHAASWGAFKDSPFEGFRRTSFVRSLGLGVGCALLVGLSGLVGSSSGVIVAIGVCYAGERLVTEWWKAILREDRQSAYSIPMRLSLRGRPIDARLPRYLVGAGIGVGLVALCAVARALEQDGDKMPSWVILVLGGAGGWLTALGGAWKDAPVEGFQRGKFFRSPVVATAWGCLLLPFSPSVTCLAFAAGGLSVATIETYKTFLSGGPPGKFAGKTTRFEVSGVRDRCRRVHGAVYAVLAAVLAVGLLQRSNVEAAGELGKDVGCLVALVWASCYGALVLVSSNSDNVVTRRGSEPSAGPPGRLSDADIRGADS
jgi:hypothetical protein